MKNYFKWFAVIFVGLLCVFLYHDSFNSPFFQDDKFHLSLIERGNVFEIIPNFPFRPISLQIFYGIGNILFGHQVFGYHLILFVCFLTTIYVLYLVCQNFKFNKLQSLCTVVFYGLNISMFANFYWVAVSYFVLGSLFSILSLNFYLKGGLKNLFFSFLFFVVGLLSNEMVMLIPVVFVAYDIIYRKRWNPMILIYFFISTILYIFRFIFVGLPLSNDYKMNVSLGAISTLKWYVFRTLNLPEGVDRLSSTEYWVIFLLFLLTVTYALIHNFRSNIKIFIFSLVWFIVLIFPFVFLPYHMSSYYISIALLGPAIFVGSLIKTRKLALTFITIYFVLSLSGLNFLRQTHWIILKNTGPIGQF